MGNVERKEARELAPEEKDLVGLVDATGFGDVALDELVSELKATEASEVNNGGLEAQVRYIVDSLGVEGATLCIKEALNEV